MIELWGKLNSMKSTEKGTVKTALSNQVVIRSFYIMSLKDVALKWACWGLKCKLPSFYIEDI